MHYAHITNNTVDFVLRVPPSSIFAAPYADEFIEDPEDVEVGWMFNGGVFTPVFIDISTLKIAKNTEINESRLSANFSTFLHNGKVIACDQLSRSDIDGVNGYVGINGTLPPDFPGAWKAVDNSYLVIDSVDAWKSFYLSMYNAGLGHFMKSQQLKAQVDACTTVEEVEVIKW